MRILHLNTYDKGGAANAAFRLHQGLLQEGVDSVFASKFSTFDSKAKISVLSSTFDFMERRSPQIEFHLSKFLHPFTRPVLVKNILPGCGMRAIHEVKPSIVHLHWIEHGLLNTRELARLAKSKIPLVWTLHDMAPVSGGFGYRESVNLPPDAYGSLVVEGSRSTLSRKIMDERADALKGANLTVAAPSAWLAEEARRSPVFKKHRVEHIPYGIDTVTFTPIDQTNARLKWNLPLNSKIILFGADTFEDSRKGIEHLKNALFKMPKEIDGQKLLLVGFGNIDKIPQDLFPIPVIGVGRINSQTDLASLYSAADVFVCPSREDNLPNTMIESLACGIPVVGFRIGGLPDFVIPNLTGELASPYNETELAQAILLILNYTKDHQKEIKSNCVILSEKKLAIKNQSEKYKLLYNL